MDIQALGFKSKSFQLGFKSQGTRLKHCNFTIGHLSLNENASKPVSALLKQTALCRLPCCSYLKLVKNHRSVLETQLLCAQVVKLATGAQIPQIRDGKTRNVIQKTNCFHFLIGQGLVDGFRSFISQQMGLWSLSSAPSCLFCSSSKIDIQYKRIFSSFCTYLEQ